MSKQPWSDVFLLPRQQNESTYALMQAACLGRRGNWRLPRRVLKLFLMLFSYPSIEVLIKEIDKQPLYITQTTEISAYKPCTEKLSKLKATSLRTRKHKCFHFQKKSRNKQGTQKEHWTQGNKQIIAAGTSRLERSALPLLNWERKKEESPSRLSQGCLRQRLWGTIHVLYSHSHNWSISTQPERGERFSTFHKSPVN